MSLFDEVERKGTDISVSLDEFLPEAGEDGYYGGVNAMNVVYERSQMAGKHGVFTLKLANYSGMRDMAIKVKAFSGDWIADDVQEITIAVDGGWELWDLLKACNMITKTEALYDKLGK